MFSIDIGRLIPRNALSFLAPLIPGGFFWVSVLFGNPSLTHQIVAPAQRAFALNGYVLFLVFLLLVWVTGNAFLLLISLIQWVLRLMYHWVIIPGRRLARKHMLLPALRRLTRCQPGIPIPRRQRISMELFGNYMHGLQRRVTQEQGGPLPDSKWLTVFVRQLLLKRFGITDAELPPARADFDPLVSAFANRTSNDLRGQLPMMASHATGWAALVARRFAPSLHTRWYATFAVFLIATGLIHDFYVAKRLADPEVAAGLYLRDLIKQFPRLKAQAVEPLNGKTPGNDVP
jgi:hypothetical protein